MTRLLPLLLAALLLAGCASAQQTVDRTTDCLALAGDVAAARLDRTPTVEDAEDAARRLDDRIASLDDGEVRDAAVVLRDRLDELVVAARAGDPAAVQQAGDAARAAARDAASTCGVPADRFLG
jgi:hypothetical protein